MPDAVLPSISIVVPSLNQGRYLEDALRSVLDQAYPRLELIVIDGGSTDDSIAILERYRARLAHGTSEPDAGPAAALNKGFARATGDVLGFLNADDFLLPGALRALGLAFAAAPEADVITGHGYFAVESGALGAPMFSDRWNPIRFRYGACVLLQPATFFRREAFRRAGGFRQTGRVCWDMELWADLASSGATFASVDTFIAAFRLHDRSITGDPRLRDRRRADARAVMAEMRGRAETRMDRLTHLLFRAVKFAEHPARSLRRRLFLYTTLKRHSL